MKTRHTTPNARVKCPDCEKMLRPLSVAAHRRLKHRDQHPELKPPPQHTCLQCRKTFPLLGNLRRHMLNRHATDRILYGCRLCPVTRCTEKAARNHMVKCARRFHVEPPEEGPIVQRKDTTVVPLRGGGSAKRVRAAEDAQDDSSSERMDTAKCTQAVMSKRQRTAAIATRRSVADETAKLAELAERGGVGGTTFRCPYHDGMVYDTAAKLELHQKQHARRRGEYVCHHCGVQSNLIPVEFLTANKLRHHLRQYHADIIRKHADAIAGGMDLLEVPATAGVHVLASM